MISQKSTQVIVSIVELCVCFTIHSSHEKEHQLDKVFFKQDNGCLAVKEMLVKSPEAFRYQIIDMGSQVSQKQCLPVRYR